MTNVNIVDQQRGVGLMETGRLALGIDTEALAAGNRVFTLQMAKFVQHENGYQTQTVIKVASGYSVDWGDGQKDINVSGSAFTHSHTYDKPGKYQVTIYALLAGGIDPWFDRGESARLITSVGASSTPKLAQTFTAFRNCANLKTVDAGLSLKGVSVMISTWANCSLLTSFPLLDTSGVTAFAYGLDADMRWLGNDGQGVWQGCYGLASFPLINTSNATLLNRTWADCTGLTSFPLIDTRNVESFESTWYGCSKLTSFPLINTTKATEIYATWCNCSKLTSFPQIDTSNCTSIRQSWQNCFSLTAFPMLDTSKAQDFQTTWAECSGLTSFPLIDTSKGRNLLLTWRNCSSLTSFPQIDLRNATNVGGAWTYCSGLTSFPAIDLPQAQYINYAWNGCSSLTSFPLIRIPNAVTIYGAWDGCRNLTSFPAIDLSSAIGNGAFLFNDCSKMVSCNIVNYTGATLTAAMFSGCAELTEIASPTVHFRRLESRPGNNVNNMPGYPDGANGMFYGCRKLTTLRPNLFDGCTNLIWPSAFRECALTQQSVDNVLVSINSCNTSLGYLDINGGTSAAPSATGLAAVAALRSRGWFVAHN